MATGEFFYFLIFSSLLALAGAALMVNFKGAADLLFFKIEGLMNELVGGLGSRVVRIHGMIMFACGVFGVIFTVLSFAEGN